MKASLTWHSFKCLQPEIPSSLDVIMSYTWSRSLPGNTSYWSQVWEICAVNVSALVHHSWLCWWSLSASALLPTFMHPPHKSPISLSLPFNSSSVGFLPSRVSPISLCSYIVFSFRSLHQELQEYNLGPFKYQDLSQRIGPDRNQGLEESSGQPCDLAWPTAHTQQQQQPAFRKATRGGLWSNWVKVWSKLQVWTAASITSYTQMSDITSSLWCWDLSTVQV